MIVSWDWLKDYVELDKSVEEVTTRLTMTGLNLESIADVDGDTAIDLEVTSNRPDCLGHIGVAREIGVLFDRSVTIPEADAQAVSEKTARVTSVQIECEDLCPRYYARVIRGVKVGPSPEWLVRRLRAVGVATINNIVDITNYVLLECGQPLHAFDFDKLYERRIVVRRAQKGERIKAINQREYDLSPEMCVIADAQRAVAVAGVMGGWDTEIGDGTTNVLIESAEFAPLTVRSTARALSLHSDSSYRFERSIDPHQLDWASRRCCQLILELAGGELLEEAIFAGIPVVDDREPQEAIPLRFSQLKRILGIDIPADEAVRILTALGLEQLPATDEKQATFRAPSWRRDLTREVDLIEEVARIHGYEQIPEDVTVPLKLSEKPYTDRITDRVRDALIAAGFFEAITMSFVSDELLKSWTPYPDRAPLGVDHSSRRHESLLRQSLIPSLLQVLQENERHGNFGVQLFEIANVYLEPEPGNPDAEPKMIGLVSGRSFAEVKGTLDAVAQSVNRSASVTLRPCSGLQFAPDRGAEVLLNEVPWGWFGEISQEVVDRLDLKETVVVAELRLSVLEQSACLTPVYTELPRFPVVPRDLNFVLDESVSWEQLAATVREAAGPLLDSVAFGGQYRGKQLAADKKSYVVRLYYRSADRTLTNDEVEELQQSVIGTCERQLGAQLR